VSDSHDPERPWWLGMRRSGIYLVLMGVAALVLGLFDRHRSGGVVFFWMVGGALVVGGLFLIVYSSVLTGRSGGSDR
jgi:hypothetical protein